MPASKVTCRFCGGHEMVSVLKMGSVALAGAFVTRNEFTEEHKYPLELYFCEVCLILQVGQSVPPETLFNQYFYFSSAIKTLRQHFAEYAAMMQRRFLTSPDSSVLEIGCNDGVLLKPLVELGIKNVLGVDPATTVVSTVTDPRIKITNDFFSDELARSLLNSHGPVDAVLCNNAYAHLEYINDVTHGVKRILKPDGVFIFEVHYLGNLIEQRQYDMIYHEHLYYYSLLGLEKHFARFDLEIFDVDFVPTHAGSVRVYVQKRATGRHAKEDRVERLRHVEIEKGYDRVQTFLRYGDLICKTKENLMTLLQNLKSEGKTIWGYGASGRANTIIQYCGLTPDFIDHIIDDAPAKQGLYTPGSHIAIKSRDVLTSSHPPDYILVFAWSFLNEILPKLAEYRQKKGKLIIPLPEVRVL